MGNEMRLQMVLCGAALTLSLGPTAAGAVDLCEKAFKDLKHLEALQRHLQKIDIDRLIGSGMVPAPCSKSQLQFDARDAARAEEMAPVAKAFVNACGRIGRHMAELELYSNADVLHPTPGAWREGCGIVDFKNPGEMAPGTIAR